MTPVWLQVRTLKDGKTKTYRVIWRLGGRAYKQQWGGAFRTKREAMIRRDLIAGMLAGGQDPTLELAKLKAKPERRTVEAWFDAFIASRVDVSPKTASLYRNARDRVIPLLGDRHPDTLTPSDIADWITDCAHLAPVTIKMYLSTLRQVLDFADVEPNPARSKKVRLPSLITEEISPPTSTEWQLILPMIPKKHRLALRLMEACGLRVNEALRLTYGDIDFNADRLRVSRARTKTLAGRRWLPVPPELMGELEELVPVEDRGRERRVFPNTTDTAVRSALAAACRLAGTVVHSPHDLRHRRISLWIALGFDAVQVKTWAGHSRASISHDTYGHIIPEPEKDEHRDFWVARYLAERRGPAYLEQAATRPPAEANE